MLKKLASAMLMCATGLTSAAPPATVVPADMVKCDVRLNITDPDPKGLNVRAAPEVKPDNIVGVLKPDGEWTTVHIAGNQGEWFLIDGATTVDDKAPSGDRASFKGRGWVHRSKVGDIEIRPNDVLAAPQTGAKSLFSGTDPGKTPPFKVMACKGPFLQVQGPKISGWAREYCTNERTTCV
ncbi:MAG: hypothetical protein JWN73_1768 [Betaproteobacteria bacterium]|nr:hypothetical protein [Betaproteobacteria bacterium]